MDKTISGDIILRPTHAMADHLIGARLRGWMHVEAGGTMAEIDGLKVPDLPAKVDWWVCGVTADGKVIAWDSTPTQTMPMTQNRRFFAMQVLARLNARASEGGLWLVAWFDGGRRFYLLWKDQDGDIQIPIEIDVPWFRLREWTPDDFLKMAVASHITWSNIHRNMEYREGQQIRLAQGELPTKPGLL